MYQVQEVGRVGGSDLRLELRVEGGRAVSQVAQHAGGRVRPVDARVTQLTHAETRQRLAPAAIDLITRSNRLIDSIESNQHSPIGEREQQHLGELADLLQLDLTGAEAQLLFAARRQRLHLQQVREAEQLLGVVSDHFLKISSK